MGFTYHKTNQRHLSRSNVHVCFDVLQDTTILESHIQWGMGQKCNDYGQHGCKEGIILGVLNWRIETRSMVLKICYKLLMEFSKMGW